MMDVFGRNSIFLELTVTRQYGDYSRLIEWSHQRSMYMTPRGKGNTRHSIPGSAQVKIQDRDNQLCFQPAAQFFIHIGIRAAMDVIACPGGKRCYVAGIVADHRVYLSLIHI